jgi:hypothetical protein
MPYHAPCRTAHRRQAVATAMAGDEHYLANPRSRKAPQSMRLDEVVTLVGFVSPETSPAARNHRRNPLPCFLHVGPRVGPLAH